MESYEEEVKQRRHVVDILWQEVQLGRGGEGPDRLCLQFSRWSWACLEKCLGGKLVKEVAEQACLGHV